VTERALMALFSRCGPIDSLWIARDPRNQASLGYGYVVYSASDQHAHARAARNLDGARMEGQTMRVRLSDRDFEKGVALQAPVLPAPQQPATPQAWRRAGAAMVMPEAAPAVAGRGRPRC
jgi:hypothetical protein